MGYEEGALNFAEPAGALYMGAGGSWELIWLYVAIGMCVIALIAGSAHELSAYRRLKRDD